MKLPNNVTINMGESRYAILDIGMDATEGLKAFIEENPNGTMVELISQDRVPFLRQEIRECIGERNLYVHIPLGENPSEWKKEAIDIFSMEVAYLLKNKLESLIYRSAKDLDLLDDDDEVLDLNDIDKTRLESRKQSLLKEAM